MHRFAALIPLFLSVAPAYAAECDLAFPLRIENGRFATVCGADLYAQRFYLFLNTRPGERVMRPDYGFSLEQYWGQPDSPALFDRMSADAETAIERFMEGIELKRARVSRSPGMQGQTPYTYVIEVEYVILSDRQAYLTRVPYLEL